MEHIIDVIPGDKSCTAKVSVLSDNGDILFEGEIEIGTHDCEVARKYAEDVYLPDMRRNFTEISALPLPIDLPPEPPVEIVSDPLMDTTEPPADPDPTV